MSFLKNALELNLRMQGWKELYERVFYPFSDENTVSWPLVDQNNNDSSFA